MFLSPLDLLLKLLLLLLLLSCCYSKIRKNKATKKIYRFTRRKSKSREKSVMFFMRKYCVFLGEIKEKTLTM